MNPIRLNRRTLLAGPASLSRYRPWTRCSMARGYCTDRQRTAQAADASGHLFHPQRRFDGRLGPDDHGDRFCTTKVHRATRAVPRRHQRAVRHRPRHSWGRRRARMGHLGLCHMCEQLPKRRRRAVHGSGCGAASGRRDEVPIAGGLRQHRSAALRYQPLLYLLQCSEHPGAAIPIRRCCSIRFSRA